MTDYPSDEERAEAQRRGREAKSIYDNPYNRIPGWPKPSVKGEKDEILACHFVDGFVEKLKRESGK